MHIEHIALWTQQLEVLREFYTQWFQGTANDKYTNIRGFESYFIQFDSGARLELMTLPTLEESDAQYYVVGKGHMAFSVGSKEAVLALTESMAAAGVPIIGEPRTTGDGYFESIVGDPDGNWVEITV